MANAFHGPRSRANARLLVDSAKNLGYPTSVVKTARDGYSVPQDVLDAALGVDQIQEGVEYDAPKEVAPEGGDVPEKPQWPGGNREAWATYAKHIGIDVTEEATRDDIKTLVEAKE